MNAGAWGREIGSHVRWVKCIDENGAEVVISEPAFAYRSGINAGVIVEVSLDVESAGRTAVVRKRRELAEKRDWMKGNRSAGSIFRNPDGQYAGQLLEQAGLKGVKIGGASISTRHANVVVTEAGARASDVRALLELARSKVFSETGVMLETEIVILE